MAAGEVTEKELDKLRSENEKLREQIAAKQSDRAEREAAATRQVEALQLQAENERLKAELAAVTEASKVGSVKAGSEGLVAQAQEQLSQAKAQAEQPVGPVDTNAHLSEAAAEDANKDGGKS